MVPVTHGAGVTADITLVNESDHWRRIALIGLVPAANGTVYICINDDPDTSWSPTGAGYSGSWVNIFYGAIGTDTAIGPLSPLGAIGTVTTAGMVYNAMIKPNTDFIWWPPGYRIHIRFAHTTAGTDYYRIMWWNIAQDSYQFQQNIQTVE